MYAIHGRKDFTEDTDPDKALWFDFLTPLFPPPPPRSLEAVFTPLPPNLLLPHSLPDTQARHLHGKE